MAYATRPVCIGAGNCSALAFSPDARQTAAAFHDGEFALVDLADGRQLWRNAKIGWVVAIDWLGADALVCMTREGDLKRIDPASGEVQTALPGHKFAGRCLKSLAVVGPHIVASGGNDGALRFWNLSDGQQLADIAHGGPLSGIRLSPDGAAMIATRDRGGASYWDFADHKDSMAFLDGCYVGEDWVQVWSPDSRRFVAGAGRDAPGCRIYDRSGSVLSQFATDIPISAAAWAPDGRHILFAHGELVSVADPDSAAVVQQLAYPRPDPAQTALEIEFAWWAAARCVAASYGGTLGPELRTWHLDQPARSGTISFLGGLSCLAVSADASAIALGDENGAVHLVAAANHRTPATTPGTRVPALKHPPRRNFVASPCAAPPAPT